LLRDDIKRKAIDVIKRHVRVNLNQAQFDMLVSYVFNTGSLKGTQLLKNLNKSLFEKAAKEMDINTQFGSFVQGLENRRIQERDIFRHGYPN
jgi:GH24 family phage-related lysozyme (muramidase)